MQQRDFERFEFVPDTLNVRPYGPGIQFVHAYYQIRFRGVPKPLVADVVLGEKPLALDVKHVIIARRYIGGQRAVYVERRSERSETKNRTVL